MTSYTPSLYNAYIRKRLKTRLVLFRHENFNHISQLLDDFNTNPIPFINNLFHRKSEICKPYHGDMYPYLKCNIPSFVITKRSL